MTSQPVVLDDALDIPDPNSVGYIIISEGVRNDLRMCLQQALEYLELGEHDGGWAVFETIHVELLRELAETVILACDDHLLHDRGGAR
jgi:hypothetical protein